MNRSKEITWRNVGKTKNVEPGQRHEIVIHRCIATTDKLIYEFRIVKPGFLEQQFEDGELVDQNRTEGAIAS